MESLLQRYEQATMHNLLVHTPLNLTFIEARLFSLALACIHKKHKELPSITIKFSEVFENANGSDYATLTKACEGLMSKVVKLQEVNTKRPATELYNIISFLRLEPGTGMIVGTFNNKISPYLISLTSNFTTVEVETLLTLKSPHTHRLMWFLKSHEYQEGVEISVENMRKHFFGEEEEPSYAEYFEFKRKVITPALAEINAVGNIDWQVSEVKAGLRKVVGLRFSIPEFPSQPGMVVKKSKKSVTLATPAPATVAAPATNGRAAQVMQVVRDEPTIHQPAAQGMEGKVRERMKMLLLTPAQIKTVLEVVKGEAELVKLMKLLHPLQRDFEQDSESEYNEKTIAGLTIKKLKSTYSRLYAAWNKE